MKKCLSTVCLGLVVITSCASAQSERLFGQTSKGVQTALKGGTVIADPGFEGGTPNASWTEASTNFGTPICDINSCGTGLGTGPNSGNFWVWFGGIAAPEEGSVTQEIDIPSGDTVTLSFAFESVTCDGTGFFEVLIDGNQELLIDETNPLCGTPIGYSTVEVDLSAYQGQTVNLNFHSIIQGDATINFFIDDITLEVVAANTYSIGGVLTGLLTGNEVTIQNNLGDDLLLSADGSYTFATELNDTDAYDVTVLAHPVNPSQTCTVTNASGVVASADVTNVDISCDNLDLIFRNGFE
jgi:hypothetical protein